MGTHPPPLALSQPCRLPRGPLGTLLRPRHHPAPVGPASPGHSGPRIAQIPDSAPSGRGRVRRVPPVSRLRRCPRRRPFRRRRGRPSQPAHQESGACGGGEDGRDGAVRASRGRARVRVRLGAQEHLARADGGGAGGPGVLRTGQRDCGPPRDARGQGRGCRSSGGGGRVAAAKARQHRAKGDHGRHGGVRQAGEGAALPAAAGR